MTVVDPAPASHWNLYSHAKGDLTLNSSLKASIRITSRFSCCLLAVFSAVAALSAHRATLIHAQSIAPIVPQAALSFSPRGEVKSLSLTGTATWQTGATTDTGTATLTGAEDGSGSMNLVMSKRGAYQEKAGSVAAWRSCKWNDASGVARDGNASGCAIPLLWFMPSMALQPAGPKISVTDQGTEQRGDMQVRLLSLTIANRPPVATKGTPADFGNVELGLDPTTLLPAVLHYRIYPDSHRTAPIDVEVRYGRYSLENGVQVPHSIQRRMNGSLDLDIQITAASLN
jgi:hypothetical protein